MKHVKFLPVHSVETNVYPTRRRRVTPVEKFWLPLLGFRSSEMSRQDNQTWTGPESFHIQ